MTELGPGMTVSLQGGNWEGAGKWEGYMHHNWFDLFLKVE